MAIETTGRLGSVAVLRGQRIIRKVNLNPNQRSASTLAPALQDVLKWCQQQGHPPALVSVADGPGSFTGLRIGVTTAKTLSYALDLPLVSVDSLAAIATAALHAHPDCQTIWAVLNAYRGQVFLGKFVRSTLLPDLPSLPLNWTTHPATTQILQPDEWAEELKKKLPDIQVTGDKHVLGACSGYALPRECDAVGVGLQAIRAMALQHFSDPMQLVPRYLKPSAAEEKANSS